MGDLDLPFEPHADMPLHDVDDALFASGAVVMAASIPHADESAWLPALVFRFARADGSGFAPPIALVMADGQEQLEQVLTMIRAAGEYAITDAAAR